MTQNSVRPPATADKQRSAIEAVRQMRDRLDALERRATEPIAVIGIGCRFPGGVSDPESFWQLLIDGVDAVREVPPDRWNAEAFHDRDPHARGKMVTRWAGFVDDIDRFDAEFFGISPREARLMDPQQRFLLEVSWEAFEDAGIPVEKLAQTRTGVYTAIMVHDYIRLSLASIDRIEPHSATGVGGCFYPNRLSYFYDLHGPSLLMDSACSGSLAAIHLACQSLRLGESDLAVAGGVNVICTPHASISLSSMGALSPTGRCHTFDAAADGYARGEGCGMVVLKRLSEAQKDGDRVYATIRGSSMNHGGRTSGLTVPNGDAQEQLIRDALKNARVAAEHISYVEAHGTGTPLGDPIEVMAIAAALGDSPAKRPTCAIGTVKTNLGHLESAAGVAALIKTALAAKNRTLPPSLHFREPNVRIPFDRIPYRVQTEVGEWRAEGELLAGVSSFGMGGTNAHLIVGEAPAKPAVVTSTEALGYVLPISAKSEGALKTLAGSYATLLAKASPAELRDICFTAATRRSKLDHRATFSGVTREELHRAVAAFAAGRPDDDALVGRGPRESPSFAFVYTGQGAQWPGAGRALYDRSRVFREAIDAFDAVFRPLSGWSVASQLAVTGEASKMVAETQYAQPCLTAIQVGLTRLLASLGIVPKVVLGHSVGEIAAAEAAGILTLEDAARLIFERGRTLQRSHGQGRMAALEVDAAEAAAIVARHPGRLALAAVNASRACVLSGDEALLESCMTELKARGARAKMLAGAYAFHSHQMDPHVASLAEALHALAPRAGTVRMVSTVTGRVEAGESFQAGYWSSQVRKPVMFRDAVLAALQADATGFLEIGPHPVLGPPVESTLKEASKKLSVLGTLRREEDDVRAMLRSLAGVVHAGGELDWRALLGGGNVARLPPHPWNHQRRHWVEDAPSYEPGKEHALPPRTEAPPAPAVEWVAAAKPARKPQPRERAHLTAEEILPRLRELVAHAFHSEASQIDPDADLLALGADSMILLEVAKKVEGAFGVSLEVGEVFRDARTIRAIATLLEAQKPLAPEEVLDEGDDDVALGAPGAPEESIQGQLDTLKAMLAELGGARAKPVEEVKARPARQPTPAARAKAPAATPHVGGGILNDRQRDHLTSLAGTLSKRLARSKALTAQHRGVLADPRATAGFRRVMKEAIFPLHAARSKGARFWDIDGNEYVDVAMGFGSLLCGHAPSFVASAIDDQIGRGMVGGGQLDLAAEAASKLLRLTRAERALFVTTGTEAVMLGIRAARAVTGRRKIVVFSGAYHGHSDEVSGMAHSDDDPRAAPLLPGISTHALEDTLVLTYGSPESFAALEQHADDIAVVLVEPVRSRTPDFQPHKYLLDLRRFTAERGIALLFDEMITGFRIHPRGAQSWFGVDADLVTYGKTVGAGLPIGVLTGRAEYLDRLDPRRGASGEHVASGGTHGAHSLTMAAACALLGHLEERGDALQAKLNGTTAAMVARVNTIFASAAAPIRMKSFGSLFRFDAESTLLVDTLVLHLLLEGVYVPEIRNSFLSTAHAEEDIHHIEQAVGRAAGAMREGGFF